MHAVFVTFSASATADELDDEFRSYAAAVLQAPGFIAKTWIGEANTIGGFYVFDSAADADQFLAGDLFAAVRHDGRFSAFEVRRFEVAEELSALTGGVPTRTTETS